LHKLGEYILDIKPLKEYTPSKSDQLTILGENMNLTNVKYNKAVVSSKGQIVIPKKLREETGIHAGSVVIFIVRKNTLEIRLPKRSIDGFFGRCKRVNAKSMNLNDIDAAIAQAVLENDEATKPIKKTKRGVKRDKRRY
jgi:AbrB family looped-hinge helix DNA binding protein